MPNDDTTAAAFLIAMEGECDPRRDPARGERLGALLDSLTRAQLDAISLACQRLDDAAAATRIHNFGFEPMKVGVTS